MNDEEAYARLTQSFAVVEMWGRRAGKVVAVQPGSRLAADDALTAPYQLSHAVAMSIGVARDHMQALRSLIADAGALHMAAPFTLARAAMESAAQALWLLTPAEQSTRVTRRLQMAVRDAKERHAAGLALGEPDRGPERLAGRLERFAGLADAAGVPRSLVHERPVGWAAMVRKSAAAVDLDGPGVEGLWRLGSGYAHGQPWSLITAGDLRPQDGPDADDTQAYVITADVPTVWTMTSTAMLLLDAALKLREHHRLRWSGPGALNV